MNRIKEILRRNVPAMVFFGIILFGVLSFVSSRNQEIERVKELETFANGSFALIENQWENLSNKTLIMDDIPESYDEIVGDLESLQVEVDEIIQSIPDQGNSSSLYDETVGDLETFLVDIFTTLEIESARYSQEKDLLEIKDEYFRYKDGMINSSESAKALDVLYDVALFQQWYFETDSKEFSNSIERNNELISEIKTVQDSQNTNPPKLNELYDKTGFFVYTKAFRISQKKDLQNDEYLENLDSLYENLKLLKSQYSLE